MELLDVVAMSSVCVKSGFVALYNEDVSICYANSKETPWQIFVCFKTAPVLKYAIFLNWHTNLKRHATLEWCF